MNQQKLFNIFLTCLLLGVLSCNKVDTVNDSSTQRLVERLEYENGKVEKMYAYEYNDGLLMRIDEYVIDDNGDWKYKEEIEFSYKANFEVGVVSQSIEYPSHSFYHRRSYLAGKLVETHSPEQFYPFVPAFTDIYQWEGDLLMQITGFMQEDTISKTTLYYEGNNLVEQIQKAYDLAPWNLIHWKSEYTYEESLIKEVIVYENADTSNTWTLKQKAVNEYYNSKLTKTSYYNWKDDTYEIIGEDYFYYNSWGNLGLWRQYNLLTGEDIMIEYIFESGQGNHGSLFIRKESELWKQWYPYPAYYFPFTY